MSTQQILIVAPPGRLQEGLQVLLATIGGADVVVADNIYAAQAEAAKHPTQLAILAGDQPENMLISLVDDCPAARFLLLVRQADQKAAAEAAGADAVLVEGASAARLLQVVRRLLAEASTTQTEARQ